MSLKERFQRGWNAFRNRDPTYTYNVEVGPGDSRRPDRPRLTRGNERSIVNAIIARIAIDCAQIDIKHVIVDDEGRYLETVNSGLNNCLNVEANLDQSGRAFRQDIYTSILDEGVVAIAPIDTDYDPDTGSYEIHTMRTGKITQWHPAHVRVNAYDERDGKHHDILLSKRTTAIVENPLYSVMNEPNSTLQRLVRKLNLLDAVDEQSSSGKLDLIIQLPYVVKTPTRKEQAEKRRQELEEQLAGSKYGIAYTDGTERITQLNRPIENNLMKQVEYLTNMLHSQLGITQGVMDGTADEQTMINYYNRTRDPIISAVVDEMKRKFLTKTARTRNHSIQSFSDPFKLATLNQTVEAVDKLGRAAVMTSNEFRQKLGLKPSKDPDADKLRNKNLNEKSGTPEKPIEANPEEEIQNEEL
jgi:hypothetical protein